MIRGEASLESMIELAMRCGDFAIAHQRLDDDGAPATIEDPCEVEIRRRWALIERAWLEVEASERLALNEIEKGSRL